MAAVTTGWAQWRGQNAVAQVCSLNGILNGAVGSVLTNNLATSLAFEVTAGSPFSVRWGYNDPNNVLGTSTGANTVTAELALSYDDTATATEFGNPVDSFTQAGGPTTLERNKTLTPTKTGTIHIRVRVRVIVTATSTLLNDVTTDHGNFGSVSDITAAGVTFNDFTAGLVRIGTTFSSFAQSGLGGSPGVYHETETNTLTLGAAPNTSLAQFTHTISWRSAPGAGNQFTTTTVAAYTSTTPNDGGKLINNVFPAASTNMTWNLSSSNSNLSNSLVGGPLPWIHFTTVPSGPGTVVPTNDAAGNAVSIEFQNTGILIDPRLTLTRLLQADDNAFGTPPLSKNIANGKRLTSQLGFYGINARDARGTLSGNVTTRGVNGLSLHFSFVDANNLTTAQTADFTTVTQGGETGWVGLKSWADALPGGNWTLTVTSNTSDATGLLTPSAFTLVLLAKNLDIQLVSGLGPDNITGNHWHPGDTLLVSAALVNQRTQLSVVPDAAPQVVFLRLNNSTNVIEIFKAGAWTALNSTTFAYTNMVAGADATSFVLRQATNSTWNMPVLAFILSFFSGVPYFTTAQLDSVSSVAHPHDHYVFDPTGLFK